MKRILLMCLMITVLAVPAWQWMLSVSSPWVLFEHQLPPGQWCYLLSKLVAQYAFLFLTAQIVLGLLLAHKANQFAWLNINLHRMVGIGVFVSIMTHAGLFIVAAWSRSGHFPVAVVGLHFDQGYYNFFVSMGILSFILLIVVVLMGLGRNRIQSSVFRYGHRLAWLVWALGFYHSVAIGTETNGGLVWSWFYRVAAILIGLFVVYRIYLIMQPRVCRF